MAKVFILCGKICSGKSTYSQKLRKDKKAVILSVDDITLTLLGQNGGNTLDVYVEKLEQYFFQKSVEIVETGINVILDWGFWTKSERDFAKEFYGSRGIEYEFYYISISDEEWYRRLENGIMMFWKKSLMHIMLMKDWQKNSNRFLKSLGKMKLVFGLKSRR